MAAALGHPLDLTGEGAQPPSAAFFRIVRRHPRSAAGDWAGRWIARSCGACADLHPEAELQEVLLPPGSWLSRYLAARGFVAITIGRRVFVRVPLTDALYRHELEHVRQWARWGAIFPVAYGLASLASRLRGAGWKPSVSLAEGIALTVATFRDMEA